MKKYIKIMSFLTILSISFYFSNILFNRLDRKTFNILNFNKDKIDLLFIGSSHSYSTFNTRIFDNKLKINSYALSSDAQPIEASYYLLKEFYKKRTTQIVVFELYGLLIEENFKESYANVFNSFSFGKNKINASNIFDKSERIDYLIPIIKYHSIWKEPNQIIKNIIALLEPPYKGSITYWENSTKIKDNEQISSYKKQNFEINLNKLKYLKLIKEEVEKNNGQLIFTIAPIIPNSGNYKILYLKNKVLEYIPDIEILDFNSKIQEIKISKADFLDHGHLNSKGSIKISEFFSDILKKNYSFKEKNYILEKQKYFNEFYLYTNNLKIENSLKIENNNSAIKNIIAIPKNKSLNNFLHLLDGYNIGIISNNNLKDFLKSKERF
ncbi:MAG: hypothetical protein ACRC1R_11265, partial [Cetobacterium sp.]|uniref:hypothetical protein n=1 Tax=Cetobacterium sp. TaxID=2071632 RepID=UPI003F34A5F3